MKRLLAAITLAGWGLMVPVLAQTYVNAPTTFSWVATTGHTPVVWTGAPGGPAAACTGGSSAIDDDISEELPLGFTFQFGATNYTTVRIMSNGRLQFNNTYCGNGTAVTTPRSYPLPFPNSNLNRVLRIYGNDLDPSLGGTVTHATAGTAPNRQFVVTWSNVPEWNAAGSFFNLQVIVRESGDFIYQYGSSNNTTGGAGQIGWQLSTTDYAVVSYTTIGALANTARRYYRYQATLSGTVFEDLNYGGGAGRDRASALAAGGSPRSGARIELYNAAGAFLASTTTDASGAYSFTSIQNGTYTVRVVNETVSSARAGYVSSLRAAQTFRTVATSGTAVAVTDVVGGQTPRLVDAGSNTSSATLASLTTATTTAQSFSTVTVSNADIAGIDFGFSFNLVVNVNNSGQGSLRQFITNANALGDAGLAISGRSAGIDHAVFMISNGSASAGLRSTLNYFTAGIAIISPTSALPTVTSPVVIDGRTQPGWVSAPIIELRGTSAGAAANGLRISAGGSIVRGLTINRFSASGILLDTSGGNTVAGCYIGTNSAGTAAAANAQFGIRITNVANNTIGGTTATQRNVISGNTDDGIYISGAAATGNVVQGNYIGINAAGNAVIGNTSEGMTIDGAVNTLIGGTAAGAGNVIGGNTYEGIWLINGATGTTIQGNWIGTDPTGTLDFGNIDSGIGIGNTGSASNSLVGGTVPGAGNVIAFNRRIGVAVDRSATGTATGNAILGNSIHSNTGLGIDIDDPYASPSSPGVTPNDLGDADAGGNNRQNFPVLTSATVAGGNTTIAGTLNSAANTSFRIEFFSSPTADPSGYGEGRVFLGFVNVSTDGSGNASFNTTLTGVSVTVGHVVSATATDAANNTSEFAQNVVVASGPPPGTVPGGFNAFETTTASGATTGVIKTRIADASFSLSLVALDTARTALLTTFTGSVTVELLDASNNTGALNATTNCRATWTTIQTLSPNPAFIAANNGRINVSFVQSNAWRDVRVRVTTIGVTPAVTGCSTDNFAIRPATLAALQATDDTDSTPGVTRVLDNSNALSGVVHRAGRQFTVLAQARSASGATTTGYNGSPTLAVLSCVTPAGCTAGALSSTLSAVGGSVSGSASYSEAGVISVLAEDLAFASVDAADSSADERAIRSAATTFGRFIADNYAVAVANLPTLSPGACGAGGNQTFTFLDQPFAFATAPQLLVTSRNAANQPIANARPRFTAAHVTPTLTATAATTALAGDPVVASVVHTPPSLVSLASSSFRFARDAAVPVASFTPVLRFNASIADTTEPGATAPISGALAAPYGPLAFASGTGQFHYGRVVLRPSFGDIRRELYVPLEIQRFNGTGWVALTDAANCLVAPAATFAYSEASGALATAGTTPNCASRVMAAVVSSNGRAAVRLPRPGPLEALVPAAMTVTLNVLAAASGQTCSGATLTPAGTLAMPWLAAPDNAGNHSANPRARVTWGRQRGDYLMLRERFD